MRFGRRLIYLFAFTVINRLGLFHLDAATIHSLYAATRHIGSYAPVIAFRCVSWLVLECGWQESYGKSLEKYTTALRIWKFKEQNLEEEFTEDS